MFAPPQSQEPDTLVTPMASCGFFHIDHLLKIELELAYVMHNAQKDVDVAVSPTYQGPLEGASNAKKWCMFWGGARSPRKHIPHLSSLGAPLKTD